MGIVTKWRVSDRLVYFMIDSWYKLKYAGMVWRFSFTCETMSDKLHWPSRYAFTIFTPGIYL